MRKWKIEGINLVASDSIYQEICKAVDEGNLTEAHLQKVTGWRAPITIDFKNMNIHFSQY